jgi:hypothetical protein
MSLRWWARDDETAAADRLLEAAVPLMRWRLYDGTQCLIAAVGGAFEVCLVRHDTVVQIRRFSMPGPAFDMARTWRHDADRARTVAVNRCLPDSFSRSPEEGQ